MALSTCHNRVSPFRFGPSFADAAVCSRTFSGIHWALVRWMNFWLCLQATLYLPCFFTSHSFVALPFGLLSAEAKFIFIHMRFHNLSSSPDHPAPPVMPKLRLRMSCRRASSRGQIGRQAFSSTSDSSTFCSDFCIDRYPATRSGRGRGRGLHNIAPSSFQSSTNSARLQFPCSHGTFSFMATITIELSELNSGQEVGSLRATMDRPAEDRPGSIQTNFEQSKASGSGKSKASQSMKNQAGSSDDDDDYKYGCRIIEEPPDPSPDV